MSTLRYFRRLLFASCLAFQLPPFAQQSLASSASWQVYFSPRGGATSAIVQTIDDAKSTVLVQAYSFTSEPIAEALAKANGRGVDVQVLLDKSQRTQKYTATHLLIQAGISVLIDGSHAIAHNKIIIIDNETVIKGSFNFTKAVEERNAENLLIIRNKGLAILYIDNWRNHKSHSTPIR